MGAIIYLWFGVSLIVYNDVIGANMSYQNLGNLVTSQRLGTWEGMGLSNLGMGVGGRRGRRGIQRQERKLEQMQQRLAAMQQDPNKAQQVARLQERIAHKTLRLDQRRARHGLTIPGLTPTGLTLPAPVPAVAVVDAPAGWNEAAYLTKYPDVAEAVRLGRMSSGLWHYNNHGKNEGRGLGSWSDIASNNKIVIAVLAVIALCWWKKTH